MGTPKINWTNREIEIIINCVKQCHWLYDRRHPDYNNNIKKEASWISIAAKLFNKNASQVKFKWNTLRIQQRRLVIRSRSHAKTINWPCFNALQFLVPHMEWKEIGQSEDDPYKSPESNDQFETEDESIKIELKDKTSDDEPDSAHDNNTFNANEPVASFEIHPTKFCVSDASQSNPTKIEIIDNCTIKDVSEILGSPLHTFSVPSQNPMEQDETSTLYTVTDATPASTTKLPTQMIIPQREPKRPTQMTLPHPETKRQSHIIVPKSEPQHQMVKEESSSNTSQMSYFLMDVQQEMDKLNDIAQMEMKIEIQKLLLLKMKDVDNWR